MAVRILLATVAFSFSILAADTPPGREKPQPTEYVLGPGDQIKVWALGLEELSEKPMRIDPSGFIDLPMLGRLRAGGLTVEQLKKALLEKVAAEVRHPQVSVDIMEYGSQPVSVMGSVNTPGVHQLQGRKNLVEVLSIAGGLRPDAGSTVKITRQIEQGPIPLPGANTDASGKFSVAEVKVKDILGAEKPVENILIRPQDVITVPRAHSVSVIGEVRKPGTFALNERDTISVLEALSMAEGLGPVPAPQNARILRPTTDGSTRQEIPVDVKRILAGKSTDVRLQPDDVLLIPASGPKKAMTKVAEAAISTVSGVIIWRRP